MNPISKWCSTKRPTRKRSLFRKVAPSLVITHPRLDYMSDHEQVHLLARSAAFAFGAPNASSLPLVEGSAVPWVYYCDPVGGIEPYSGQPPTPTTYVEIGEQLELKLEMLACHVSQREWLRAHHGMDEYLDACQRFSAQRGQEIGVSHAEAFVQHLGHPYPQNDLLRELFGKG
jgi:LmbE family N-acetylglucosaminyl deacetylase